MSELTPYTNYTFSGYAKVTASGQAATLGVSNFDTLGTVQSLAATSTAGYTYIAQNFTTGAVATSANLWVSTGSGCGGAYADDLFLNLNRVENPDFESGTPGAWQLASGATISEAQPHGGDFALQTNGTGSTGKQTVCGLIPATAYIFSAWAKLGDSSESAHIAVQKFDSTDTVYELPITTTYANYPKRFITGPNKYMCYVRHLPNCRIRFFLS